MVNFFAFAVSVAILLAGCGSSPTDVLIASKPSNAIIFLNDVEIGLTPMEVTVDKKVSIEIRKDKFISYQATLSSEDAPNLLVKLEPEAEVEKATAAEAESPSGEEKAKKSSVTITQLKYMYKTGKISKSNYELRTHQIRSKMDMDLRAVKERYRRAEINRSQYNQEVKRIKHRYLG